MAKQTAATLDPKELLKQIEADDVKALAEFKAKLKEQREKKLAGHLEPLKKLRGELASQRNDIDIQISDIDKQIASLTGAKAPSAGKTRAKRKTNDEKLQIATLMYGAMTKGKEYSAGDLETSADGVPVARLVELWNKANKDKKIDVTGNRATTRYVK